MVRQRKNGVEKSIVSRKKDRYLYFKGMPSTRVFLKKCWDKIRFIGKARNRFRQFLPARVKRETLNAAGKDKIRFSIAVSAAGSEVHPIEEFRKLGGMA